MSAKPAAADSAKAPPKSKKMLIIVGGLVVVLLLVAGGGWFYISKQRAAAADSEEEVVVAKKKPVGPPTFMPLDSMVVNLADPGGEKVAQIGITFELVDAPSADVVKSYLPAIRSGILMLASQRTSAELLQIEGKEKLAADIMAEASRALGGASAAHGAAAEESAKSSKKAQDDGPIRAVLFSSFIVQ